MKLKHNYSNAFSSRSTKCLKGKDNGLTFDIQFTTDSDVDSSIVAKTRKYQVQSSFGIS